MIPRLGCCIVLIAHAAAGQTAQDLVDEAEAMRAKLLVQHPRFRGEGPPWLMDKATEALAVAKAAGDTAADRFFAAHQMARPKRIHYPSLMSDMLTPEGEGSAFWLEVELPGLKHNELRALAESVASEIDAAGFSDQLVAAHKLPVREDRTYEQRVARSGELRLLSQFLDTRIRHDWAEGRRATAHIHAVLLASMCFALESEAHLFSFLVSHSMWHSYRSWVAHRIAANEFTAADALLHFDVVQQRFRASPGYSGTLYTIAHLVSPWEHEQHTGQALVFDESQYRELAKRLGQRLRASVDASPEYRLEHYEQSGNEWFAMYSMIDDTYPREFDHAGGYNAFVAIECRRRNVTRALETDLAIRLFELDSGSLPASLDALVPEYLDAVPVDAFCGEPLRYEPGDDGRYALYSVGWDGVDNGGRLHPDGNGRASQAPGSFFGEHQDPTGFDHRLDPWSPE